MKTNKRIQTLFLGRLFRIVAMVAIAAAAIPQGAPQSSVNAAPAEVMDQGTIDVAPTSPTLTAVDPLAWSMFGDVLPARPFLYSVDANGITITRFNDNQVVGTWPWPESLWIELPDGSITEIPKPAAGWEPVGMTVSYPTETEIANRVKEIPDLTPPWTFVYVVMAHSGYEWRSEPDYELLQSPNIRDTLVESTNPDNESALLLQINVSDPSFSTWNDPTAPSAPHVAGAILGHEAGQPVYDRSTGNIYVGNMPSMSLPTTLDAPVDLTSFVSVIHRIPPEVTAEEAEIPGISKPVVRCGPQHPEVGIPVGRPQAYACYDPSGYHPIDDNEHVGAYGEFEWEFRNWPDPAVGPLGTWLTAHTDLVTGELDGILYGTPPVTGDFYVEVRVHNLDDPYGVWSDWHPIHMQVNPTAEYLPIKAQFAAGVPVAYQLEGTGSCTLSGAPAWIDIQPVPNGCVVMGRAPISGENYEFTMPDFRETGYPDTEIEFSGNVVGAYNFDALPEGVGISGLAWHQVEKYQDPSTEPPVMTLEFIGVDPDTGQLYQILQPAGQPQPPNERPAETMIGINTVSAEGDPLGSTFGPFGEVAVEADRDIYVAASSGVFKVAALDGVVSNIALGFQPSSLSLDSDLRTAIPGVEPGQVDHGALWAAGSNTAALIDTDLGTVAYTFDLPSASSVSADFDTQFAYVADPLSQNIAIFGPFDRPPLAPRIWSSEEVTWNVDLPSVADGPFKVMATGDLPMTLSLLGDLPEGVTFVDNGDGTATISGIPSDASTGGCGGEPGEGDPEGGDVCGGFAFALTATNAYGTYVQALGMDVNTPPTIESPDETTFYAGSASSFTMFGTGIPEPIFYTWDELVLEAAGVQLVDNENGTASLVGTPPIHGTFIFTLEATTGHPPDAAQAFTLRVEDGLMAPTITSLDAATWEVIGAPFAPDPFAVTSIGSPTPELSVVTAEGQTGLPPGVTFIDNGDSTATFGGDCQITWPGMEPSCLGLLPDEAEGTWTFTIRASNSQGFTDQTFTLDVEITTSIMTPGPDAPANLAFAYTPGGPLPPAQTFSVRTLGDTLPYAAVTTADWLSATPENGWVSPDLGDLSVSVDPTGLAPGTHTGTILVASAGTEGPFATALVTLTVVDTSAPGELGIFPSTLRFEYNVNEGILPPAQTVLVMSGGEALDYTVSTGEARWLSATPVGGTAPTVFSVSVDPRVGNGMHIANLTITSEDETYGLQTQIIPVTLLKTAGNPNLIQVMFDVGSGPEGLATNLNTHNLFITSSNAAAEAAEAGQVPVVEMPGPPEPALVYHVNPLDMTVVGRIVVHGEAEYIGVNSTTGLAYQASVATGEIAVIDGSTNSVLTYIDLTLDGDPQTPYQVAIDEAQNIIYVGAKSPEPEPYALIPDENGKYGCKAIRELPSDEAPLGQEELDCWHAGPVIVIDGETNQVVSYFMAGDDPEGVMFAAATGKVYASNEDDGSITVAQGAVRNADGSITPPEVIGTIIGGELVPGWWEPTCDENNYCGERENLKLWLWPELSECHGIDDEAEEADKMAVDPAGNIYIIDDRYRLAKIDGATDAVVEVIEIPGFDCEATVPDDSPDVFRNTANNIAYMAHGQGKLYVVSEQNTVTLIEWLKKGRKTITKLTTLTIPGALELDAITTDPAGNRVYITDEALASLWILKGACANGEGIHCTP